ncbi:MAG: hypothetical protein AAF533_10250 [Acidobacteriota bacterium]
MTTTDPEEGRTVSEMLGSGGWEELPGCPGRHRLRPPRPSTSPQELAGVAVEPERLVSAKCRDPIELLRLPDGALLSYRRSDGSWGHTLNTTSGLERKLRQLELLRHDPDLS